MVPYRYNYWRHGRAVTVAPRGFWLLLAVLIPMNPEEPTN